jgi:hypothetical protein
LRKLIQPELSAKSAGGQMKSQRAMAWLQQVRSPDNTGSIKTVLWPAQGFLVAIQVSF